MLSRSGSGRRPPIFLTALVLLELDHPDPSLGKRPGRLLRGAGVMAVPCTTPRPHRERGPASRDRRRNAGRNLVDTVFVCIGHKAFHRRATAILTLAP